MPSITLKPGREKSVLRRHPWIFSGAIQRADEGLAAGATVDILSSRADYLGRGFYSPHSQIRARVWSFENEPIDAAFFRARIRAAFAMRRTWNLEADTDAVRLVYAESDGIPGLIVDRYGQVLVMQLLTAGVETWREAIVDILQQEIGLADIFERSDADVRELEGLPVRVGPVRGELAPHIVAIHEHGLEFGVNLASGHKTGFYLDQRRNRQHVRRLAQGREVLDCFCYS